MEIEKRAVFNRDDIAYAIKEYLEKRGLEMYLGTFDWKYKDGIIEEVSCLVFDRKEE